MIARVMYGRRARAMIDDGEYVRTWQSPERAQSRQYLVVDRPRLLIPLRAQRRCEICQQVTTRCRNVQGHLGGSDPMFVRPWGLVRRSAMGWRQSQLAAQRRARQSSVGGVTPRP